MRYLTSALVALFALPPYTALHGTIVGWSGCVSDWAGLALGLFALGFVVWAGAYLIAEMQRVGLVRR